jgi:ankyrin repeat protein
MNDQRGDTRKLPFGMFACIGLPTVIFAWFLISNLPGLGVVPPVVMRTDQPIGETARDLLNTPVSQSTEPPRSDLNQQLLEASRRGKLGSVESLLQQGASPLSKDDRGNSVLDEAARSGNEEIVKKLLAIGAPVDSGALHAAAFHGNVPIIRILIAAGADLDDRALDDRGWCNQNTPIFAAALNGQYEAVVALLDAGANANVCSSTGYQSNPLHGAADSGSASIARVLLQHGALVDSRGQQDKVTPLMVAAKNNKVEVLRVLLEAGANPLLKDATTLLRGRPVDGLTASMIASEKGNIEALQVLNEYIDKYSR